MSSTAPSPILSGLFGDAEVGSCFSSEAELRAMLEVEAALAGAQAEVGLIEWAAADRIAEACRNFHPDRDKLAQGLTRDGVLVPELVKQLRAAIGEPYADVVHLGATSQDIIDTGLILRLKAVTHLLAQRLDGLSASLENLKTRGGTIPLMAHTRMQQALPFMAADKIDTWLRPVMRHREALREMMPHLLVVQLGGPIGTREGLKGQGDAVAKAMAERLGLGSAPCWHAERDRIGAFASWLSLVSGTLGKIGQDIALLVQNEVGQVRLSSGGGSSAMPHKSNPVQAELLVTLARFNAGLLGTLHQALVHENERSGAAWSLEWLVLPQMAIATGAGLRKALALLEGLTFIPYGKP